MQVTFNSGRVRVYSLEVCPNCHQLKEMLDDYGIPYDDVDMQAPEWITEMRVNGCFAMEAPVLQVGEEEFWNFHTAMERIAELR